MPKHTAQTMMTDPRERERYLKMPILLVFDYLKGYFFKVSNENEELK